jgi:hypothetical protein
LGAEGRGFESLRPDHFSHSVLARLRISGCGAEGRGFESLADRASADNWLTIGIAPSLLVPISSPNLGAYFIGLLEALDSSRARLAHRLCQRIRARVHGALGRRDVGVAAEQLHLVNGNAIISEAGQRLVDELDSRPPA